jgi:hypothetical protein
MDFESLGRNQLAWTGKELVKVSEIYLTHVTAQTVLPVTDRTTVRAYDLVDVMSWSEPTKKQMKKYQDSFTGPFSFSNLRSAEPKGKGH